MDIKEIDINATLYVYRAKDHRDKEWEYVIYLRNARARTVGFGFNSPEPVPFLRALGLKVLENKRGYLYYSIGCAVMTRDPAARWYTPPPPIHQEVQKFYDTLPMNKMFKSVLTRHSQSNVIEFMKEGITGVVETEAFE